MAFGVGVGIGNGAGDIDGGVAYGLGQIDPIMPAELKVIGGLARLRSQIRLLYRILLGSALANIGACARAPVISLQSAALEPTTAVGFE